MGKWTLLLSLLGIAVAGWFAYAKSTETTPVLAAQAEFRPGVQGESLEGSATDEWTERLAERVVQLLDRPF